MIRVLHSIDTSGPGGAETVLLNIVKDLDSNRFKSVVAVSGRKWLYESLKKTGINPIVVNTKGAFNIQYLMQLIKIIRKNNIDLLHSHLFGSNVYCCIAGLLTHTPVISTFHGFVDADVGSFNSQLKFKIVNLGSKKIIFVSDHLKNYFVSKAGIKNELSRVVYNGVDTDKFHPDHNNNLKIELGLSEDDIIVGSIGNIRPAKNYDLLLKTAELVKQKRDNIKFVIAGQGSGLLYDALLNLRKDLNLENTVFFLGLREDTVNLYHNFDIFLLTSSSEGFSISTIEAMACGLPVIVTRSGGPEEIVDHNINGILTQPDKENITDNILSLTEHHEFRKKMSLDARKAVLDQFAVSKIIKIYERLYHECYNKSRK